MSDTLPPPERAAFEAWLLEEQMLHATWNPTRNCYDEFPAHLAFRAWKASALQAVGVERGRAKKESAQIGAQRLWTQPTCWCESCDVLANGMRTRMALCPECGDKRCNRSQSHQDECSAPKAATPPTSPATK